MLASALSAGAIQFYVFKRILKELDRREILRKDVKTNNPNTVVKRPPKPSVNVPQKKEKLPKILRGA